MIDSSKASTYTGILACYDYATPSGSWARVSLRRVTRLEASRLDPFAEWPDDPTLYAVEEISGLAISRSFVTCDAIAAARIWEQWDVMALKGEEFWRENSQRLAPGE